MTSSRVALYWALDVPFSYHHHHVLLVVRRQHVNRKKYQPVYENETWHTDRVLKPHVQRHTNIIPVSFGAL